MIYVVPDKMQRNLLQYKMQQNVVLDEMQPNSFFEVFFRNGLLNIARGTTDPGYRVYNLSYLSS